jgi:hypothetical protein
MPGVWTTQVPMALVVVPVAEAVVELRQGQRAQAHILPLVTLFLLQREGLLEH